MNGLWSFSQAFEHFLFGQNKYKLTQYYMMTWLKGETELGG